MAEVVYVFGRSGSGKSRSLINFAEDEIFLVNVEGKRLPFQKKFKYTLKTDSYDVIRNQLSKMPTKVAVIDDAGYLMTNMFMRGHLSGDQFKMYNMVADGFWSLVEFCKTVLPEDVIVYFMMHEETSDTGETKIRTIGKLLDQKVCLEGLVTIVLRTAVKDGKYYFITQNSGSDIAKSPEGMFDLEIPNDLKAVDDRIREYWGITSSTEKEKK